MQSNVEGEGGEEGGVEGGERRRGESEGEGRSRGGKLVGAESVYGTSKQGS